MKDFKDLISQVTVFLKHGGIKRTKQEIFGLYIEESLGNQLTEDEFYKYILKPAYKDVDIEELELQEKQNQDKLKYLELEAAERQKEEGNATIYVERLVKTAFEDGIVEGDELRKVFAKATELKQDIRNLAILINKQLDVGEYKSYPRADFDAPSLKETLISTNWYNPSLYSSITAAPRQLRDPLPWAKIIVSAILLIILGGTVFYYAWYKDYLRDKNAARKYSYANSLSLRSAPVAGVEYTSIENIEYGTEILIYSEKGDWAECKANGKKGYVSSQYLLNKREFQELNGILADQDTKDIITTTKWRKALMNYYNSKGIMGKIAPDIQKEIYGSIQQKEVWQVFAKPKNSNPNNVAFPKIVNPNSKYSDFACIIKSLSSGKRKFLLFSFADDEKETLQVERDAPDEGYIQSVSRYPYNVVYAD